MGFGILFIGYFLLLNVTGFTFTDLIAALVMALAFYKLSAVEKIFKNALILSYVLIPIGLSELIVELWQMFDPLLTDTFAIPVIIISSLRYLAVAGITYYMLSGIRSLASEVGIPELKSKSKIANITTTICFILLALIPQYYLGSITIVFSISSIILLFISFVLIIYTLTVIYSTYMQICMPEDNDASAVKPSKFGFVNKFREHTEKRNAEYAEYKLGQLKKKGEKKKKK